MFVMEEKMLKLITFQNQLFSPNKFKSHVGKGFSSQIIPGKTETAEEEEPTSPKVSCMGRMKHKSYKQKENKKIVEGQKAKESYLSIFFVKPQEKIFSVPRPRPKVPVRAPSHAPDLGHLSRYASVHSTLAGLDARASSNEDSEGENEVIIPFLAPVILGELGGIFETANMELKPKKEINLWKRRTMAQPRPLQVAPLRI